MSYDFADSEFDARMIADLRAEIAKLQTALRACRLVLIDRGVRSDSRIIGAIDSVMPQSSALARTAGGVMITISSDIKPNFQTVSFEIEAWFYAGQPFAECPHWVQSKFQMDGEIERRNVGRYALRDDEGYFWRWMDATEFNFRYVRIMP